jgi:SAM-dependent methyltransferase
MNSETIQLLLDINSQFYQKFGDAFAATRRRVQPGIHRILIDLPQTGHWLDLGCGSGTLALTWLQQGRHGSYSGVDFSLPLLTEARHTIALQTLPQDLKINFFQADLLAADWMNVLTRDDYDGVLCFAALHHIPAYSNRLQLALQVRRLLAPGGLFIHSNWQFQNSPKLMERVLPWESVSLSENQVEAGDTLLDWRYALPGQQETVGTRYVHLLTLEELSRLAAESGFEIIETFESDGQGGRLGLYQRWKAI